MPRNLRGSKKDILFLQAFRKKIDDYLFLGFAPSQESVSFQEQQLIDTNRGKFASSAFGILRREINEMIPRAQLLLSETGQPEILREYPPLAVGGPAIDYRIFELITNNKTMLPIPKSDFLDRIDQAIGALKIGRADEKTSSLQYDFSKMHPRVRRECESLFKTSHYAEAILKAFILIGVLVKQRTGLEKDGKALMADAFNLKNPLIRLNEQKSQNDRDEQEGFMLIYMGVMEGIRNPKAHDIVAQKDPARAYEYLALASLLARRLDDGEPAAPT
jgi:uncharacterized protein (TIGR02391 family)